jgi:chromosome segregation ATPase
MRRSFIIAGCTALALGLSACDSGDEARLTELERDLETSRTEVTSLRGELDQSRARVQELEGATVEPGAGAELEELRDPMAATLTALRETDTQLLELEQALTAEGFENISLDPIRANLAEAGRGLDEMARTAGIDPETLTAQ